MRTWIGRLFGALIVAGLLASVACASTASPSPSPSPAKQEPAAAKPAQSSPSASQPAQAGPASSSPAASADWKAEWDKTVAAAKKEGTVVVAGGPGDLYRKAMAGFEKAYPEIKLEYTGIQGSDFRPKVLAEREGGQYLWDVHAGGWNTPLFLIPRGVFDPLRPALMLPEVLDSSKWLGGFDGGWVDKEKKYEFSFSARLTFLGYVNRDAVPEAELRTVDQLLDPKWKGKISSQDPRLSGPFSAFLGYLIALRGEDFVRKLLAQDLVIVKGGREQAEALVRARLPIGLTVNAADIEQFTREGLMASVKPLAPDTPEGRRLSSGFGNVFLMNRAPHPNAAKVFINWLLSREGQKVYVETTGVNSRRLDVDGPAETAAKPNAKYEINEDETSQLLTATDRAMAIGKEMIK